MKGDSAGSCWMVGMFGRSIEMRVILLRHTYDEKKANQVCSVIPQFLDDAKYLLSLLQKRIALLWKTLSTFCRIICKSWKKFCNDIFQLIRRCGCLVRAWREKVTTAPPAAQSVKKRLLCLGQPPPTTSIYQNIDDYLPAQGELHKSLTDTQERQPTKEHSRSTPSKVLKP